MLTLVEVPAESVPLAAGLKVTVLPMPVLAVQFTVPPVALRLTVHM
jgi:hypothetical protein